MKYTIAKMFQILRHNRWVSILMIIEIALDENFQSVISGKMTPTQLRKSLGMTHSTFYRYRKTFYENIRTFQYLE